ncbi:ABC transporter permease [Bacillus mycoides]|uniref:ABC transporter permease n=1 Tax=Bacillus mycoides TaxID=1405 RepID=UPI003CFC25FC
MRLSDYLTLSRNNFLRNGFKTFSPIIIITLAIIVFNVITGFFSSITDSMNNTIIKNDSLKFIEVVATPDKKLNSDNLKEIKKIAGVASTFPKVQSFVGIEHSQDKITTNLIGVDSQAISFFTTGKKSSINGTEIILNSTLSDKIKSGDSIKVNYTIKVKEGEGIRKFTDAKILSLYDQFYINNYPEDVSLATIDYVENLNAEFVGFSLEDYRRNLTYDFGTVIVKEVEDVTKVAKRIESMGYDTSYSLKSSQSIPMVARIIVAIGGIIVSLLLVFSGISIASIISQSLRGRYKEIGIMRAVGYQRNHLIKLFSIQVLYISLISFILSISLSFIIIKLLSYFLQQSKFINYQFNVEMDIRQIAISFILILLVSFVSSFRPIMKASSTSIIEIIRGNAS